MTVNEYDSVVECVTQHGDMFDTHFGDACVRWLGDLLVCDGPVDVRGLCRSIGCLHIE